MAVSFPRQSKFDGANAGKRAMPSRPHKSLYRVAGLAVIAGCVYFAPHRSAAQQERPQITPGEKKVVAKKDRGPRALGLLQLSSNGKATLVPIVIQIGGKFYDAASYKAKPIPMALESGTVYEAESTGKSLGLFTVNGALHSKVVTSAAPWIGTGSWLPAGSEAAKTTHKAEDAPVGLETSDGPPRLSRGASKDDSPKDSAPKDSAPTDSTQKKDAPAQGSAPKNSESKSAPSQTTNPPPSTPPTSTTPASAPAGTSAPPASSSAPPSSSPTSPSTPPAANSKPSDSPPDSDSNTGAGENRPKLRRGKPTDPLPTDQDVPGYTKPDAAGSAAPKTESKTIDASGANTAESTPTNKAPQLVPAISDASGPDPRAYTYEWAPGYEDDRRKQMLELAAEQFNAYLAKQAKQQITSKPTATGKVVAHKPVVKAIDPVFENVEMRTFDLWGNNQPVMVMSMDAHLPLPSVTRAGASVAVTTPYTITLVARTDIYNNIHKLYAGVTDKYHLDLTPRLQLIDAVDADGDGIGELLFRETSDAGSGYVIYRATADVLWKMFDTLNPD